MLFNSVQFALFFPIVTLGYFLLPHRARWAWLLAASAVFYMAFIPRYILILAFTISIDYAAGLLIAGAAGRRRKLLLFFSIAANAAVLAVFKYWNFGVDNLNPLIRAIGWNHSLPVLAAALPVGLSFHTFQSMSYTIEVYRGRQQPERHLGILALYVLFYPQLVAGPIERPQNLLAQLRAAHRFDYRRVVSGLRLMIWGLFKKVVIADRLARFVATVYDSPAQFPGISVVLATVFFAVQIYCDFSGYSDIALGAAKVMGVTLMENFRRPYFARSISEFWLRWHISLSTWFRDYVYIPLGGSRVAWPRWYANLLIVFAISGIWHGANWTFAIWGILNGVYLILERVLASWWPRFDAPPEGAMRRWCWAGCKTAVTFGLICSSWVFFRAPSAGRATGLLFQCFSGWTSLGTDWLDPDFRKQFLALGQSLENVGIVLAALAILIAAEFAMESGAADSLTSRRPVRWALTYAGVIGVLFFGAFNDAAQFIYFQF